MIKLTALCAPILALCAATQSSAAVINFGGLTQAGTGFNAVGPPYSQDGFHFTSVSGGFGNLLGAFQSSSPNHPAGGNSATSLTAYYGLMTVTIAPASGNFDLLSIDLGDWGANQGGGAGTFTQSFTGTKSGGGTVSQTFTISRSATPTLTTFTFSGFTNLTSVSFTQGIFFQGQGIQFNNLVVSTPSAVPEPGVFLLSASALLALLIRRRSCR